MTENSIELEITGDKNKQRIDCVRTQKEIVCTEKLSVTHYTKDKRK